ncbi:MAG: MgtC/SapB family protein [Candidatus Diapherotrites archaeon]|nr:MgtC/SapB family protein [Candidatus Micrarchaeota archaeon]MBU1939142.1 MgtC/SapB family protein [Candidatus Micrarchaeota archaeon]
MLPEIEMATRLVVAFILGAIVGYERETSDESAGLRTHILVCVGATLFTIISLSMDSDPARIAAGIVTGVGFLGAGTIFKASDHVKGLTTAASIWAVSAIGLAIGMAYYTAAAVTTIIVFIVLYLKRAKPMGPKKRF